MNDAFLKNNSVLPANFDGTFKFTNFTDHEFKCRWNSVEYTFPANKTIPLIISNATPEEVQSIRKKFAKELAEQEFYKSDKLKSLESQNPIHSGNSIRTAVTYNPKDLEPYIQRCLEPLPIAQATVEVLPKITDETSFRKDNKGRKVTKIIEQGESLLEQQSAQIA